MLEELLEETVNHLEREFYNKEFKFSYSSLCKLIYSPAVFYQMYVLGHKEEKIEKHLIEGKVIHCLLLDDKSFDKQFLVSPTSLPNATIKLLVDKVFYKNRGSIEHYPDLDFEDFEESILETMESMNYHQSLKTDKSRLEKVISEESKNYWDFLKKKAGRDLIDQDTLKYCKDAVDIVKLNSKVCMLLGIEQQSGQQIEIFNEEYIDMTMAGVSFGFKGILDNLQINHTEKTIYINDFKTSGKSLKDFKESIEFYSYWLQSVLYMMMVSHKYFDLLKKGYSIKFHFIVIDKYFNVYPFPVSEKTRMDWLNRFQKEILPVAKYHYESARYELPYEYDTASVIL